MIVFLSTLTYVVLGYFSVGFHFYTMTSASMAPILPQGQQVLAIFFNGRKVIRRGDLVVFEMPRDHSVWLKRVIGIPGDHVQLVGARLFINNTAVPRAPHGTIRLRDAQGKPIDAAAFAETLPEGRSYVVVQTLGDQGYYSSTPLYTVPAKAYFLLGDNRDNSTDSRIPPDHGGVGFVPEDRIIAHVPAGDR